MTSRVKKYFWRACQKKPWKVVAVDQRPSTYNLKCAANPLPVDLAHWPVSRTLEESRPRVLTLTLVLLAPRERKGNYTQSALGKKCFGLIIASSASLGLQLSHMTVSLDCRPQSKKWHGVHRETEAPLSSTGLLQWSVEELLLKCKCWDVVKQETVLEIIRVSPQIRCNRLLWPPQSGALESGIYCNTPKPKESCFLDEILGPGSLLTAKPVKGMNRKPRSFPATSLDCDCSLWHFKAKIPATTVEPFSYFTEHSYH